MEDLDRLFVLSPFRLAKAHPEAGFGGFWGSGMGIEESTEERNGFFPILVIGRASGFAERVIGLLRGGRRVVGRPLRGGPGDQHREK